jgi:histidine triad (HIT) family protein
MRERIKVSDCLFCKIAKHELKSEIVLENDTVAAFRDINPQAPQHILVIPKRHINAAAEATKEELSSIFAAADKVAEQLKIKASGFRMVFNQGKAAGQAVPHLHLHVLGGRGLNWPPG